MKLLLHYGNEFISLLRILFRIFYRTVLKFKAVLILKKLTFPDIKNPP